MDRILVITGDYHFGDNAGIFQEASYIGYCLKLPLRKTWINNILMYEGEWVNGNRHGKGKLYRENNTLCYEGEWKDGNANGQGKSYDEDGILYYEGEHDVNGRN